MPGTPRELGAPGWGRGGGAAPPLVLLNYRLPPYTAALWERSGLKVCADGGANRLFDQLPALVPGRGGGDRDLRLAYLPDVIVGDLDSLRDEVRAFYAGARVKIVDLDADQDSTDMTKAIRYVQREAPGAAALNVVGVFGGRFDHELAALNTLCTFRDLHIVLLGEHSLAFLVPAGPAVLNVEAWQGPACGLVPIAGATVTTTKGLRWDMDRLEMAFGGLVSTSNVADAARVDVEGSRDLVWTIEVQAERFRESLQESVHDPA